jgi:hypothetical protein
VAITDGRISIMVCVDLGYTGDSQRTADEVSRFFDWHGEVDRVTTTDLNNLSTCWRRGIGAPVALDASTWDKLGVPVSDYDPDWVYKRIGH